MQLNHIFTLANAAVRLQFLAMERSLRAAGCDLPLKVIPYDDNLFELPANAFWHVDASLFDRVSNHKCHPTMRKYVCLLESHYHFLDCDIIVLKNPETAVRDLDVLPKS